MCGGDIFFLDGKCLNSAVAFKKPNTLVPLEEPSRFTLAMAYLALNQKDWAREELEQLNRTNPNGKVYWYWLGRLDYDTAVPPSCWQVSGGFEA